MENLINYVRLRKDISLEEKPFNPVDMLMMAELAYVDWEDIVNEDKVLLRTACKEYITKHDGENLRKKFIYSLSIPELVENIMESDRYKGVYIQNYKTCYSEEEKIQFGAVTFELPNKEIIFSFRGTDGSITGWKENMMMTYQDDLACQQFAKMYIEDYLESIPETKTFFGLRSKKEIPYFYMTGHSKGGNLAMYAAYTLEKYDSYLKKVYNFDGPGFRKSFYEKAYKENIVQKIESYIPKGSIIGRLLEHKENFYIIDSCQKGLSQHDGFSWSVNVDSFVSFDYIESDSDETLASIDRILLSKTKEEREAYIDLIFKVLDQMNIQSISDLTNLDIKRGINGLLSVRKMNHDERKFMWEVLNLLMVQSTPVLRGMKKQ